MRITNLFTTIISGGILFSTLSACDMPHNALLRGLPNSESVTVSVPEKATQISGLNGASRSALVGEPAEFYTTTYQHARQVNKMGKDVVTLLEAITSLPPTSSEPGRAVWGPGSDEGDPNIFRLTIEEGTIGRDNVISWALEGKHKSADEDSYESIAQGNFDPDIGTEGRGWFEISLDTIGKLNATDERGTIAFRFQREGAQIDLRVDFMNVVDDNKDVLDVGYAFKKESDGSGSILFDLPVDIHEDDEDAAQKTQRENLLIRSRWNPQGLGQVDLLATGGDLDDSSVELTQCWGALFVSVYEGIWIDGRVQDEAGDATACAFSLRMVPAAGDLTAASDVSNPFR
jgi:hypothetical protein